MRRIGGAAAAPLERTVIIVIIHEPGIAFGTDEDIRPNQLAALGAWLIAVSIRRLGVFGHGR
jgi:hypothetical protein